MAHILVVDDEEKMRHLLALMLERGGHRVQCASDGMEAYDRLKEMSFDMVISDIKMPRLNGTDLLQKVNAEELGCPFVFITAFATVDHAVETMRMGAADYITKPFDVDRILLCVERTLNLSRVMAENRALKKALSQTVGKEHIVSESEAMANVIALTQKVARSNSAVMIHGESGTGKELLARFIHKNSRRAKNRFMAINCAAISPNLVESELFGYEKGAFTGADQRTEGKFEFASQGTLFMDEIGDLPLDAQAKLLRTLQEKSVRRVGGNEEIPVDVRIVCATNKNLDDLVASGQFRQDLYYRINVVPLELPPLRDRIEDIPLLCRHFLKRLDQGGRAALSDGAIRMLQAYPWPGNVRELANAVERATIVTADGGNITRRALSFLKPPNGECNGGPVEFKLPPTGIDLEAFETDLIRQALKTVDGNQTQAAKLLGITRAKFRTLMKQAND